MKNDALVLFVLVGAFFGWIAGRHALPWHIGRMVGIGGWLGFVAFYVYDRWGVVILIGGWLALALLFWGADWFSNFRRQQRQQCQRDDASWWDIEISPWLTHPTTKNDDKPKT